MTHRLLILLLLMAIAGLGWLAFGGKEDGVAPPRFTSGPQWEGPSEASQDPDRANSQGASASGTLLPTDPHGVSHTVPARVDQAGDIVVQVVDTAGDPLAGVKLIFLDCNQAKGWQKYWKMDRGRNSLIRSKGRVVESDAQGRVQVTRTTAGVLTTRSPGEHGDMEWHGRVPQEPVLRVSTVSDLRVFVLSQAGGPLSSVPILVQRVGEEVDDDPIAGVSVAPRGEVLFPNLRRALGHPVPGTQYAIVPGYPCADVEPLVFDPLDLPEEPLELRLPATGSLRVRVLNENGVLMDEVVDVTLGVLDGEGGFEGLGSQRLVGGEALFGHVGVGAQVAVRLGGSALRPPLVEPVPAPRGEGAESLVELTWDSLFPVVVGRAVLAGGQVLSSMRGRYTLSQGSRVSAGPPLTTDRDGRFRIIVAPPLAGAGRSKHFSSTQTAPDLDLGKGILLTASLFTAAGDPPLESKREFQLPAGGGEHELGDLVLVPAPLMASGHVRSPVGESLLGVYLRIEQRAGKDKPWVQLREQTAVSDHLGAFKIYGPGTGATLRVVAMRRGYETTYVENLVPGSTQLIVTMPTVEEGNSAGTAGKRRGKPQKPGLVPDRGTTRRERDLR